MLWGGSPRRGNSLYHHCRPLITVHSPVPHTHDTRCSRTLSLSPPTQPSPVLTLPPQGGRNSPPHTRKGKKRKVGCSSARDTYRQALPASQKKKKNTTKAGTAPSVAVQGPTWPASVGWLSGLQDLPGERKHTHNYFMKDWAEQGTLTRCAHRARPSHPRGSAPAHFLPSPGFTGSSPLALSPLLLTAPGHWRGPSSAAPVVHTHNKNTIPPLGIFPKRKEKKEK